MTSVQRLLSSCNNHAAAATRTASSVRASTAIARTSAQRTGGGRVRLAGAYTGHEATGIDVLITDAAGIPRASVPQFAGVGSGTLQVTDVQASATLQGWSLTLTSTGIDTQTAGLDVREVRIIAKTPGTAGNSIRITVTPALTLTAAPVATLAAWNVGQDVQTGPEWDGLGALPLSAKGELDTASPRIAFGSDPQVYRPWRRFKDGAWQTGLSPELQRTVREGTQVFNVAGDYSVAVTDGTSTETYPGLITLTDMLQALAASALVEVSGVVAQDRTSGGQAAVDIPLRTSAWLLQQDGKPLDSVQVAPTAPTQTVTVRCINADIAGQERWAVSGTALGAMGAAITGQTFVHSAISLLVPSVALPDLPTGDWNMSPTFMSRLSSQGVPHICTRPFRLGRNARPQRVTFVYTKRPPSDCDCAGMPPLKVSLTCLGLSTQEVSMDIELQNRLKTLYEWRSTFMTGESTQAAGSGSIGASINFVYQDANMVDAITTVFAQALQEIYDVPAAASAWDTALTDMQADMTTFAGIEAVKNIGPTSGVYSLIGVYPSSGTPDEQRAWYNAAIAQYVRKYSARMDHVRTIAGISPKSNPSSSTAGSCWVDPGDAYWWVDDADYYLPAFTNSAYVSARRHPDTGAPYSTQEFGFGLVVACPERLVEGDRFTINILNVDQERPYRVGDEAQLRIVAGGPAYLVGGVDGTDEHTWSVAAGGTARAPYVVPSDGGAIPPYTADGVTLAIAQGGIPFALGDTFTFSVEAGQYQWRRDGGAWSAAADIPPAAHVALADGLDLFFDAGAAPSFVPGDAYSFAVHQPWAASHLQDASASAWGWQGASASMVLDLGALQSIDSIAIARYSLPAGAQVSVQFSDDSITWSTPAVALNLTRAVSVKMVDAQAHYLRLNVAGAPGGSMGWLYAGQAFATRWSASNCTRTRRWAVARGNASINPSGMYAGQGDGWRVEWSPDSGLNSALFDADLAALLPLLDYAQQHDEPIIFVPHHLHPEDASLVRVADDALDVSDIHEYQPDNRARRLLSATLALEPVYA